MASTPNRDFDLTYARHYEMPAIVPSATDVLLAAHDAQMVANENIDEEDPGFVISAIATSFRQ